MKTYAFVVKDTKLTERLLESRLEIGNLGVLLFEFVAHPTNFVGTVAFVRRPEFVVDANAIELLKTTKGKSRGKLGYK